MAGSDNARAQPPRSDELEVSLLGPGYGECVVLHFAAGAWAVVDSCVNIRTKHPAALEYFDAIGVDPVQIRLLVATHWHDDHIRGLVEILRLAEKARFVLSMALRAPEFTTLVSLVEPRMMQRSSGLAELAGIYAHLAASGAPPQFAMADRRIWQPAGKLEREIWALSPSDHAVERALHDIAALFDDANLPNRRVPALRPNTASIVLWCGMAGTAVLLGGDLEESSDNRMGWRAIVSSTSRPKGKAGVFKLPHHGSANGHSDDVWAEMVDADPIAIVTPYARGGTSLPTTGDRTRIRSHAADAYITSERPASSAVWPTAVEATLAEATTSVRDAEPAPGHVRLRRDLSGGPWRVELFGGAAAI